MAIAPPSLPVRYLIAAIAWLGCGGGFSNAAAQARIAIPGGVLRGSITDSVRQSGLSYALVSVVGADRRTFASDRGGFAITGLKPGLDRIRVQQIGYAPVEIGVLLVDPGRDPDAAPQLTISLGARVQVLPELNVTAMGLRTYQQPKRCVAPPRAIGGPAARLVIDQAVTNADRILALELGYPFIVTFEHVREAYDAEDRLVAQWIDTIALNPARRAGYWRGAVLGRGRRDEPADAVYFTMGDLARTEFQRAHCLWYLGVDSTETGRIHRVEFEPAPDVKTADWAGSLQFDWESFQLVRSDARLVRADRRAAIQSAQCAVSYGGEIPTIVHEQVALCLADPGRPGALTSRDVYRAIATRFLGVRPGDQR